MIILGRVRPVYIKKISKELLSKYNETFSDNFEKNKELLAQYAEIQSKLIRNRIAGYIVHLVKLYKKENEVKTLIK